MNSQAHLPNAVVLSGPLILATAAASRAALLAGLETGNGIVVDCSSATDVDVTLIQLLLAARRSAGSSQRSFALAVPLSAPLEDALDRAGLRWCISGDTADFDLEAMEEPQ